jgi:hypothetical protein
MFLVHAASQVPCVAIQLAGPRKRLGQVAAKELLMLAVEREGYPLTGVAPNRDASRHWEIDFSRGSVTDPLPAPVKKVAWASVLNNNRNATKCKLTRHKGCADVSISYNTTAIRARHFVAAASSWLWRLKADLKPVAFPFPPINS